MSIRSKLLNQMSRIKVHVSSNRLLMDKQEVEEFYRLTTTLESIWAAIKQSNASWFRKSRMLWVAYRTASDYCVKHGVAA